MLIKPVLSHVCPFRPSVAFVLIDCNRLCVKISEFHGTMNDLIAGHDLAGDDEEDLEEELNEASASVGKLFKTSLR